MTIEHNPDKDEVREALDAEVREDEAAWDKARAEFDEFRNDQKGRPTGEVEKALHTWLRRHGIALGSDALAAKASKIAAGEAVELVEVPSAPKSNERPGT